MSVERAKRATGMGQRKVSCALACIMRMHIIDLLEIYREISGSQTISYLESMNQGKVQNAFGKGKPIQRLILAITYVTTWGKIKNKSRALSLNHIKPFCQSR